MRRTMRSWVIAVAVAGCCLVSLPGVAAASRQWANIGEFSSLNEEAGTVWIEDKMFLFDHRLEVIDVDGLPMKIDDLEDHTDETVTYTVRGGRPHPFVIKIEFEREVAD